MPVRYHPIPGDQESGSEKVIGIAREWSRRRIVQRVCAYDEADGVSTGGNDLRRLQLDGAQLFDGGVEIVKARGELIALAGGSWLRGMQMRARRKTDGENRQAQRERHSPTTPLRTRPALQTILLAAISLAKQSRPLD